MRTGGTVAPLGSALAVGSLAVGIAANAAVFVLLDHLTTLDHGQRSGIALSVLLGCAGALLLVGSAITARVSLASSPARAQPPRDLASGGEPQAPGVPGTRLLITLLAGIAGFLPARLMARALVGLFLPAAHGSLPPGPRASVMAFGILLSTAAAAFTLELLGDGGSTAEER